MCRSNHSAIAIRAQLANQPIDQTGLNERFVALYINDELGVAQFRNNFGDPIGATAMFSRGKCNLRPPAQGGFGNPAIVGGDDDSIKASRTATSFPYASQKRLASN
jgi:hypothetical protein